MSGKLEAFNQYQQETRARADSLIRIVLVIASGSLAISSGLYFQENAFNLSGTANSVLRFSWWLLSAAIVFSVLTLYTIVLRDYLFGERSRKNLSEYSANDITTKPRYFDEFILIFGHLGMLCFILGMLCLVHALSSAVVADT